jgi:hypothetical protein
VRPTSFIGVFGKSEEERLEARMVESFRSSPTADVERTKKKLIKYARERPLETVTILLRHYQHEDAKVRASVRDTLAHLAEDRSVMEFILEDMVHPSRTVRKAVQIFLGETVGVHAVTYSALYEQTMLVVAMSQRKDVPVDDIVSLAELSKETFMDGEVMEAVRDIAFCLDGVRHRYNSSEHLRFYLSELLRMAPDLSRMGVYSGTIEEPLRKAMKASRDRNFDETKEIIDDRLVEGELRRSLRSLVDEVKENITARPTGSPIPFSDEDGEELASLRGLAESVENLIRSDRRQKAIRMLQDYIGSFLQGYEDRIRPRVLARDQGAAAILYLVALACIKLASEVVPVTGEAAYQEGFAAFEGLSSVHVVFPAGKLLSSIDRSSDLRQT